MKKIFINAELVLELANKNEWINKVPHCLPEKTRAGEKLIWVDANGNVFETGADFSAANAKESYPCRVYRPQTVTESIKPDLPEIENLNVSETEKPKSDVELFLELCGKFGIRVSEYKIGDKRFVSLWDNSFCI